MTFAVDFTGKTILVCGVHKGGMGGATCRNIARAGGTVIALDNQQAYVDGIADDVRTLGGTIHTLTADLMDVAQCEQVVPRVLKQFGPIDGIANIAGGTRAEEWMPLDETPGDSFWKTLQLNCAYAFYLCRDVAAEWIRTGRNGAIVNVGSVSAKDAAPWHGPYGAGKSAIIALTRTMANEWHEFGIRANSVSPGAVMSERVLEKSSRMSDRAKASRDPSSTVILTEPQELANAITFLLSDLASGISGQNLTVDRTLSTKFCGGERRSRKELEKSTKRKESTMELGLLYEFEAPKPWAGNHPWGQRTAERTAYRNCVEQVALADKKGFHTAWLVEHHFREGRSHMPCNDVVLGALSQITENIRLGFGVALMPHEFIHPARIAEKVATVDLLSRGRVEWGMGRSTPMEQIAFGVDVPNSKKKMLAAAKTVTGMWEQEYYEEHSEYLDFPARMITPKPYQYPHPPCWMAASSEETIRMAGANGLGLLCFSIMQPLDKLAALIRAYREEQARAVPVTSIHNNKVGVYTLVHCTESRAKLETNRLWESVWWWYSSVAEFTLKWELAHLPPEAQEKAFPLLQKQVEGGFDMNHFDEQDMVIIGTPEECLQKFLRYEEAGVDQVLCYVNFGYLPQDAILECITLLGDYVIPELKRMGADRTARGLERSIAMQQAAE